MPLLSNFETLFEDLFARADLREEVPKPAHPISLDSLEAAWELAASSRAHPRVAEEQKASPYTGDYAEPAGEVSLDPSRIFGELGLHPEASEADVLAMRRQFALRNHPDRVPAELRDLANQRMMIANDHLDRYIARLRKSQRTF